MINIGILLCFVAVGITQGYTEPKYTGYKYNGRFTGKCESDGFYYKDSYTFVVCFQYHAYQLPCAQGSENSPDERYVKGKPYRYRDFCDMHKTSHPGGYAEPEPKPEHKKAKSVSSSVSEEKVRNTGYDHEVIEKKAPKVEKSPPPHTYNGYYAGSCFDDGFYYLDSSSFVVCSNKQVFILPCAAGSQNSKFRKYVKGDSYAYRDFCDINLVDDGYTADHAAKHQQKNSYGENNKDRSMEYGESMEVKTVEGYDEEIEEVRKTRPEGKSLGGSYGDSQNSEVNEGSYSRAVERFIPYGYGSIGYGYGFVHPPVNGYIRIGQGYDFYPPPPRIIGLAAKSYDEKEATGKQNDIYSHTDSHEAEKKSIESIEDHPHGYPSEEVPNKNSFTYRGHFQDQCPQDGFYYIDTHFFIICSNGHPFKLPCSPGTQNSPYTNFKEGDQYRYRDFCDVNKLATGYSVEEKKEKPKEAKPVYRITVKETKKKSEESSYNPKSADYGNSLEKSSERNVHEFTFNGFFEGKCGKDGFYYRSLYSFMICQNGVPHRLPCAPGSRNRPYTTFMTGSPYSYRHFCDVNLVASGVPDPREKARH